MMMIMMVVENSTRNWSIIGMVKADKIKSVTCSEGLSLWSDESHDASNLKNSSLVMRMRLDLRRQDAE